MGSAKRVDGNRTVPPRTPSPDGAIVPGVLVRLSEVTPHDDTGFDLWYQRQQLVEPLAIEGFRSARRYRVTSGEPTYMTVYECESIDVLASPRSQTALGGACMEPSGGAMQSGPRVRDTVQFACRQTWSVGEGLGGSAIIVQCKPMQGREDAARDFIRSSFSLTQMPALVRMSLWEADNDLAAVFAPPPPRPPATGGRRRSAARALAATLSQADLAQAPRWVLALESYDVSRMALAVHEKLLGCESAKTGLLVGSWTRYHLTSAHDRCRTG